MAAICGKVYIVGPLACELRLLTCGVRCTQDLTETFFRKVRFWGGGGDAPPVFQVDGVSYLHVKVGEPECFKHIPTDISIIT